MLKNNDLTLNQIVPIEIKLEETYLFKKGEEKGEKRGEKKRDKIILSIFKNRSRRQNLNMAQRDKTYYRI